MVPFNAIVDKAFYGNPRIKAGRPECIIKTTTGAPSSAAKVGTLCWNSYDEDAYICTVATGTWVQINA
jgi:hypothetical protein